jgi:hypothetical protein
MPGVDRRRRKVSIEGRAKLADHEFDRGQTRLTLDCGFIDHLRLLSREGSHAAGSGVESITRAMTQVRIRALGLFENLRTKIIF